MPKTKLDGKEIEYKVKESKRASKARIDIDINKLRVVVPQKRSLNPEKLLKRNREWVLEKKSKYDSYREQIPDREFKEGSKFPFLGEDYEIVISDKNKSSIEDGKIKISKKKIEKNSIKEEIENLYREEARKRIKEKVEKYTDQLGKDHNKVYIRNQKTKWGSCSGKSNLSFNWMLLMAPKYVLDYVVAHECAHLKERGHSKSFWEKVGNLVPEYKKAINWLKENSPKLVFSPEVPN